MKRFKLVCCFTLVFTMVFSLIGCNKNNFSSLLDPKVPVPITVWHYYNGFQKVAFDNLVDDFNETVGLEKGIIVTAISQGNIPVLTNLIIDAANKKVGAEELPNIFAAYSDTAFLVDKLGLVADLEQYFTAKEMDEYITAYLSEGRLGVKNKLKIFPIAKSTEIFMLNKTFWDDFASEVPVSLDSLSTYEGLLDVSKKYYEWTDAKTETLNDGKAFFGRDAMANYLLVGMKQLGIDIFEISDGRATINADKNALRTLWDNFYIPYINGYYGAYGRFRSDDAKTGDILAMVCSSSGAMYFPKEVILSDIESKPIEALSLPVPHFNGQDKYVVQQGAGMVVTKGEPVSEYASMVFLKWFTESSRNLNFAMNSGYMPVKKEANTPEFFNAALEEYAKSASSSTAVASMPVVLNQIQTYNLHINQAFEGGVEARNILDSYMIDIANADKEKLANATTQDERKALLDNFQSDEYFEKWYKDFTDALNNIIK